MITRNEAQFETIEKATCDCCEKEIKVEFGQLTDHLKIGGYKDGKLLEAIVCIPCMEDKMQFIKIQKKIIQ